MAKDNFSSTATLTRNAPVEDGDYDPFMHRVIEHPNTFWGALIHVLKSSLGTGILAVPRAFKTAGLVVGTIGTIFIGFLCTYSINLLVLASYSVCVRTKTPSLGFEETAEAVLKNGPERFRPWARFCRISIQVALLLTYSFTCAAYVVYISESIAKVTHLLLLPRDRILDPMVQADDPPSFDPLLSAQGAQVPGTVLLHRERHHDRHPRHHPLLRLQQDERSGHVRKGVRDQRHQFSIVYEYRVVRHGGNRHDHAGGEFVEDAKVSRLFWGVERCDDCGCSVVHDCRDVRLYGVWGGDGSGHHAESSLGRDRGPGGPGLRLNRGFLHLHPPVLRADAAPVEEDRRKGPEGAPGHRPDQHENAIGDVHCRDSGGSGTSPRFPYRSRRGPLPRHARVVRAFTPGPRGELGRLGTMELGTVEGRRDHGVRGLRNRVRNVPRRQEFLRLISFFGTN